MSHPKTITNEFSDFHILEVSKTTHHPERRGPYMVIQTGKAPDDLKMKECTFALTKSGTWMHCYVFFVLSKEFRRKTAVFKSIDEAMSVVRNLSGVPVVETMETLPNLLAGSGFHPSKDGEPETAALMEELKKRHPGQME